MISLVDLIYNSSALMTLNDGQKVAQLTSMKDQGDDDEGHSVNSDERQDKNAENVVWDLHSLRDTGRQGTPTLQANRYLGTKYIAKEAADLPAVLTVIKVGISSNVRVVDLTDQLV